MDHRRPVREEVLEGAHVLTPTAGVQEGGKVPSPELGASLFPPQTPVTLVAEDTSINFIFAWVLELVMLVPADTMNTGG